MNLKPFVGNNLGRKSVKESIFTNTSKNRESSINPKFFNSLKMTKKFDFNNSLRDREKDTERNEAILKEKKEFIKFLFQN
jgi:hypothetical protein